MKTAVRRTLLASLSLVGLLCVGVLATFTRVDFTPFPADTRPASTALPAADAVSATNAIVAPLRAGFGRARLTPTLGTAVDAPERGEFRSLPLAGYGNRAGQPATGVHDDVWVKAVAFAAGGQTGVVVAADALIIPRDVAEAAAAQLQAATGLDRAQVYFSATHTHCSLGGWGQGLVGEAFAGPYNPGVRVWFARQLAAAAQAALADLSPAALGTGAFAAPQFVRNRLVGDRGQVDPEFSLVHVRQADGDTAVLGSYSAHATVQGGDVMQFSGDYPGVWQRTVEQAGINLAVFVAGGVGSHGPRAPAGGFDGARQMGEALATETLKTLPAIALTNAVAFGVTAVTVPLPELQPRVTDDIRLRPWAARQLMPPLAPETRLQAFRFGNSVWCSTPCDFSGELALELKAEARAAGRTAVITSFNGDYLGYVIPTKYYHLDGYEPRTMNFYGPHITDTFMAALRQLLGGAETP